MTRNDGTHISVNGETVLLDRSGAAFVPAHSTLVFADLHFEKGSAFARRGALLPPYDTRVTIKRMAEAIARYQPARVVALGDSFHDSEAADRLGAEECADLIHLASRCEWIWIEGNHDPHPPHWMGGEVRHDIALGALRLRHEPRTRGAEGEVAGHIHPVATIARRGLALRRRCFVSDGVRLLLPAFGAYTGGFDVREAAVGVLFPDGFTVFALGTERVYAVQTRRRNSAAEAQPNDTAKSTVATP